MRSVVQKRSYGSVTVFWLDSEEALRRLREAAQRVIAERPEVSTVHLFGSLAEGRAVPGSDADVLVLLDRSDLRWFDRPLELLPFFRDVGMPIELFCYTREEAGRVPVARTALGSGFPLAMRTS